MKFDSIVLLACSTICGLLWAGCARNGIDPNNVPEQLNLYQLEPVVALAFDAQADTYQMQAFVARGKPTSPLFQDRDVRIIARDSNGRILQRVSVTNPRIQESLESGEETAKAFGVAPSASFVVFLPRDESMRTVEVEVVRGPNAPLKRSFQVVPSQLPPFTHKAVERRPQR